MLKFKVRGHKHSDIPHILELLQRAGMGTTAKSWGKLIQRAYSLASKIFVAEHEDGQILGASAFFQRSPQEFWGADLVCENPQGRKSEVALEILRAIITYASQNGVSWLSAQPRPSNPKAHGFFRKVGFVPVSPDEIKTPLPLCFRLWREIGDEEQLVPKIELINNTMRIYSQKSIVELDFAAGQALVKDIQNEQRLFLCDNFGSHSKWEHCSTINVDIVSGRFQIAEGIELLAPWWTPYSTVELRLPIKDQWPYSEVYKITKCQRFTQLDAQGEKGIVSVDYKNDRQHVVTYQSPLEKPCLRLTIDSEEPPHHSDNTLIFPHIVLKIPKSLKIEEHYCWNVRYRTHIHFNSPLVELILQIGEKV